MADCRTELDLAAGSVRLCLYPYLVPRLHRAGYEADAEDIEGLPYPVLSQRHPNVAVFRSRMNRDEILREAGTALLPEAASRQVSIAACAKTPAGWAAVEFWTEQDALDKILLKPCGRDGEIQRRALEWLTEAIGIPECEKVGLVRQLFPWIGTNPIAHWRGAAGQVALLRGGPDQDLIVSICWNGEG